MGLTQPADGEGCSIARIESARFRGDARIVTATTRARILTAAVLTAPLCPASTARAGDERPLVGPATTEEIATLISDLGDPKYDVRTFATRRLCAIGNAAREQLQAAADRPNVEAALRAKRVLTLLDSLWFVDTEISLGFSKSKVEWDEPVDLELTVTNRSAYPARIPFELEAARAAARNDARQVADMLDVAEWLSVRGPDGLPVELRVDEISADPDVLAEVQARLNGAPNGVLPPGERITVAVRMFNRGWARFPLLNRGRYTAVF